MNKPVSTSFCPYCKSIVKSNEKVCPSCGSPNNNYVDDTPKTIFAPKTIEELKEYCAERGMPLQRMRFFIGENFKEPCAFGIYKRIDGSVIVYKNKDNGVRAIRYQGFDEEKGVQELFLKLLDECHKRDIYPDTPDGKPPADYKSRQKSDRFALLLGLGEMLFVLFIIFGISFLVHIGINSGNGYYRSDDKLYYVNHHVWYEYAEDTHDWTLVETEEVPGNANYEGTDWKNDWGDTQYSYQTEYGEDEDDEDVDFDFDSWDSFDTDWSSDW